MDQASLIADLKASLHDAAGAFTAADDADFRRLLSVAALDMGRIRPRTLLGSVTLAADRDTYAAPADLLQFKAAVWGTSARRARRPWERTWPGPLPVCRVAEDVTGRVLYLTPAPTATQIADLGSAYKFFYFAGHQIGIDAAQTSVVRGDRGLLLLRAAAEAMTELANRGVVNPVQLHRGLGSMPSNATPAAWARELMRRFEEARQ